MIDHLKGADKMNIFVVYCHPGKNSFTHSVKDSFIKGLTDADHNVVISDLYDMQFNPVFSENEYNREAFYNLEAAVSADVLKEQEKINGCDVICLYLSRLLDSFPCNA